MSELKEIKRDGGKAQKNSGRGKISKGDAVLGQFVYDIKEYAKGFTVSQTAWLKVASDAFAVDPSKSPALKLVLGEGNAKLRLWVIDEKMFEEMHEAWREKYE